MKTNKNKKSGFTLVELMIVAAIIAILAAIMIPLMAKNKESAVAADGKNMIGACLTAAKTQYARTGAWVTSPGSLDDTDLVTDYNNGHWTITMTGPSSVSAVGTIKAGGYQGYSGTVTLNTDGTWTDALTK